MLITGGCGFIGANLVPHLVEKGFNVKILDNLSIGSTEYIQLENVEFIEGDIRDEVVVDKALEGVNTIVHLAASGSVVESIKNPMENFDINVKGTLNLLQRAVKANINKFIFASTGGALMGDTPPPVNENSLPDPISPYGASKLCCESYCKAFTGSYGINTIMLRFGNIYGPFSSHKKGVITAFIKALQNNQELTIYGDGEASRDFLYVDDLVNGIHSAIEKDISGSSIFHLASEKETSIKQLANHLIDISGNKDVNINYKEHRTGEVERTFAEFKKANEILGFYPQINVRKGLEKTWEWFEGDK